jgi:2-amino-4-hydroxy-6-hydroxymethyldihydropteridine diphosphokinase
MLKPQRPWELCYIGVGSNLGNREEYLNRAVEELKLISEIQVLRQSTWIETMPVGKVEQPVFLNGAVEIKTTLPAVGLLQQLKLIEQKLGRIHREVWGPREIDLDILFYGNQVLCEDRLTIPHPLLHSRLFVLQPMLELAPDLIHPAMEQTIQTLFDKLP